MIERGTYGLNDIVQMKKDHPCKKSRYFKIIRLGADVKLKCEGCGSLILLERRDFERKCKKIISKGEPTAENEDLA